MQGTEIYLGLNGLPKAVREGVDYDIEESMQYQQPYQVFELAKLLGITDRAEEYCYIFMFNARNQIIALSEISHGTLVASIMSPREILQRALLCGAANFIIVHNHPSGEIKPSAEDCRATIAIKEAAEVCGIHLIDHVIVSKDDFCSLVASTDLFD